MGLHAITVFSGMGLLPRMGILPLPTLLVLTEYKPHNFYTICFKPTTMGRVNILSFYPSRVRAHDILTQSKQIILLPFCLKYSPGLELNPGQLTHPD